MTKYRVVRDDAVRGASERYTFKSLHPDQPADGFPTWTDAELWLNEHFLAPHIWRVEPTNG